MTFKKTSELKNISREKMLGKYGTAIGAFLFMRALMWFASDLSRSIANPTGIMYVAIMFILALIEGVFVYGEQGIYMKIASNQPTVMNDMFHVFKGDADRAILARFIHLLIVYLPTMGSVMAIYYGKKAGALYLTVAILLTVVLMVVMIYLLLTYSQVILIMHDFPQVGVIECYKRSKTIMKGRRMTLLRIVFSFIPLHILGVLSFMTGELFIHPYYKLTLTEFYFDTVKAPMQIQAVPNSFDVSV